MDSRGTAFLGKTYDGLGNAVGQLPVLAARTAGHHQIGILVYHGHDVWQEMMAFGRKEMAVAVLVII